MNAEPEKPSLLDKILVAVMEAADKGGLYLALIIAVTALAFVAITGYNPVKDAATTAGEPVAKSLGITSGRCPDGWKDVSDADEHALVKSCQRNGWLVVLDDKGRFQHGFQLDTPGAEFKFDPREVPSWPVD